MRLDWLHHHRDHGHDDGQDDGRETPVWQASKPSWGEVRIDAPRASELAHPESHAA